MKRLEVLGVGGFPEVRPGDELDRMVQAAVAGDLRSGDVLVVTHKIVSKAEGRLVDNYDAGRIWSAACIDRMTAHVRTLSPAYVRGRRG